MTLDLVTLQVLTGAVVVLVSALFIGEAWTRRQALVDRLWSLAFLAAIGSSLSSLVVAVSPDFWWGHAVSNATTVLVLWSFWSGARADRGRPPRLWLALTATAVTAAAVLVEGPDGGEWAGGTVLLLGVALGAGLTAFEMARGSLRVPRVGKALIVLAAGTSAYYLVRLGVYLTRGPDSAVFRTVLGTEITTVVLALLVLGAAFFMTALRSSQSAQGHRLALNFDPATGARTALSFEPHARELLGEAERDGRMLCLMAVRPESIDAMEVAFGRGSVDDALVRCGDAARLLLPTGGLLGLDMRRRDAFEVLLPDCTVDTGVAWGTELRKRLIDSPVEVVNGRVRLTVSVGVACVDQHGYDLRALRDAADRAAREALAAGGNRVAVAPGPVLREAY